MAKTPTRNLATAEAPADSKPVEVSSDTVAVIDNTASNSTIPTFTTGAAQNKPISAIPNSIYYEIDTGNRVRFTNDKWEFIDNIG